MANFDDFLAYIVFKWEGGSKVHDVNHDTGGVTKYGVASRSHPGVDVANLTWAQAKGIYKTEYWEKIKADQWHPSISLIALDAAINQGQGDAIAFLQESAGAKVDHVIGPETTKAINNSDTLTFIEEYAARRGDDYMKNGRTQLNAFGLGWNRRLFVIYTVAFKIASGNFDVQQTVFSKVKAN